MRPVVILTLASCLTLGSHPNAEAKPVAYKKLSHVHASPPELPANRIARANASALQDPRSDSFTAATQIFPFSDGAVFRLFTAPDRVSDIVLQPGEKLIAISAGDTARWVIGDTTSGAGETTQVHVMVKPYTAGLKTNMVIMTNRRTYHVQVESTSATAMVAMSWTYPQEALIALQAAQARAAEAAPVASGIAVDNLSFRYAVTGDKPAWRPTHVFDDGAKVYIEFPREIAQGEMPPLFAIGRDGKADLLNYRVQRNVFIVDRLFEIGELRSGGKRQTIVRISRTDLSRRSGAANTMGGGHD